MNNLNLIFLGTPANKMKQEVIDSLNEFIQSLPTTTSHHSRNSNPKKWFLPVGMTTGKIFISYVDWMQQNYPELTPVKDTYFRSYYNRNYSIFPR